MLFRYAFLHARVARLARVASALVLGAAMFGLLLACGSEPTSVPTPLPPASTPNVVEGEASAQIGEELVTSYSCLACHSDDGSTFVGPTCLGLYGTQEELEDGSSVTVDAEYIRESILEPDARITKGFTGGLMPATLGVKEEEIPHIVEYMKSLR